VEVFGAAVWVVTVFETGAFGLEGFGTSTFSDFKTLRSFFKISKTI